MTENGLIPQDDSTFRVPDTYPVLRTDTPELAKPVPFLLTLVGIVGLWFMPARWGKRLAASGWSAAISAFILSIIICGGLIVRSIAPLPLPLEARRNFPPVTWLEQLRSPFVAVILLTSKQVIDEFPILKIIPFIVGVSVLFLATMLMPFSAAGEPLHRLYGRSLRLAMWSFTMAIPLGILWLVTPVLLNRMSYDFTTIEYLFTNYNSSYMVENHPERKTVAIVLVCCGIFFVVWWLTVLVRSGRSYGGLPEGPAWQAARPRCRTCDYIISGLAMSGQCPECGAAVAQSIAATEKTGPFTHWRAFKLSVRTAFSRRRAEE